MNIIKGIQDLYSETHNTSLKKIKGDLSKWKDILCSWIERTLYCNSVDYPQIYLLIKCHLKQILESFPPPPRWSKKTGSKIYMEIQGPRKAKAILKKKYK